MPPHPRPRLVLRQAPGALGVLNELLDLGPGASFPRQHLQWRRRCGIAEGGFDRGGRLQRPAHHQPDRWAGLAVTQRPDPRRHATPAAGRREAPGRVLGPDRRGDRPLHHGALFPRFQFAAEVAGATLLFVGRDPIPSHDAQGCRLPDQPSGDRGLGLEADRHGDVDLLPAIRARLAGLAPPLGQGEPRVQERRATGGTPPRTTPTGPWSSWPSRPWS
jgi:hypothetical protein